MALARKLQSREKEVLLLEFWMVENNARFLKVALEVLPEKLAETGVEALELDRAQTYSSNLYR